MSTRGKAKVDVPHGVGGCERGTLKIFPCLKCSFLFGYLGVWDNEGGSPNVTDWVWIEIFGVTLKLTLDSNQ